MKRDLGIDFLRGLAIILVVFSHVLQRSIPNYTFEPVATILMLFTMPIFFFVAGINMARRGPLRPLGFLYDIVRRGITYLFPAIVFLLLRTYIYNQFPDFPAAWSAYMDNAQVGLWVLWVLALLNGVLDVGLLLSSITRKHPKIHGAIWLTAAYVTLIILRFNNVIYSDRFLGYDVFLLFTPVVILGYLLGEKMRGLCKGAFNYSWMLLGFSVTILFGLFCQPYYETVIEERQFIVYFCSPFIVMALCGLAGAIGQANKLKMVRATGRRSLEIYMLHLLLLKLWSDLSLENGILTALRVAAMTIGVLAFCESVILVTKDLPFLHFLAFGRAGDTDLDQKVERTLKGFFLTH